MKSRDYDAKFQQVLMGLAAIPIVISALDGGLYEATKNGVYVLVAALALYSVRGSIARALRIPLEDE